MKYIDTIENPVKFRTELVQFIDKFPELFPNGIKKGYTLKEIRVSKKTGIPTRRILVDGISYTIRPSFVMPYHVAFSADVENALFLRKFNVPFWALSHTFGKNRYVLASNGKKPRKNLSAYSKAYDLPGCHRSSNMVDRLMQRMDRHLFATFYFHGNLQAAELSIRG